MKKIAITSVVCLLFIALCFNVSAASEYKEGSYTYIIEDGKAVITETASSLIGNITIPSTLGGYVVSGIDAYAFEFASQIESITIPDCVTYIGWNAFCGCTNLKNVNLGNGITEISPWMFYNSNLIESINIGSKVSEIKDGAFENLSGLKNINVASANTSFYSENGVLFGKKDKEILCYPQGKTELSYTVSNAEKISSGAFIGAGLKEITISASVKEIEPGSFSLTDNLEAIVVESANPYYIASNGVLFDKNKETLLAYPKNKKTDAYEIPSTTKNIGAYAFKGCVELKEVIFPKSIERIDSYAFYGCEGLNKLNIPNSLKNIGESAFSLCRGIKKVVIPEGNSVIEKYAFIACDGLDEVTFFKTISLIDSSAFGYCNNLIKVNYTGNESEWNSVDKASGNAVLSNIDFNKFVLVDFNVSKGSGDTFNATADIRNAPQDGYMYVAAYSSEKEMLEIKELTANDLSAVLSSENVDDIKLFVWDENMNPLK